MKEGPITIEVTQEDIDQGLPENAQACPIALAIRRTLNAAYVSVDMDYVDLRAFGEDKYYEAITPDEAEQFIQAFDNGQHNLLRPAQFTFEFTEDEDELVEDDEE